MSDRGDKPTGRDALESSEERALSARMRDLDRRLGESRVARKESAPVGDRPAGQGYGLAMRLGADFVAGIVVGAALGWGIDRLFGTSPWGLIVFLFLGFGAGILSLLRTAGLVQPGPPGPDDLPGAKR